MINQDKEKTLNIYRASAGSGKTHLLTGFYLKLLFVNELLPETHQGEMRFGEILAVTFTNKATAEMKGRIIDELFLLSVKPETSDYLEDIAPSYSNGGRRTQPEVLRAIREKARKLLIQILNEYSSFNISTIDSFFQKIVRSFARELNIPGNYEVELDADRVLDAAVSNFLDKLDARENPDLFNWMVSFSKRRIEENAGWDFRSALLTLAKKVLGSEEYRSHSDQIRAFTSNKKEMREYAQMLDKLVKDWRERLQQLGQNGLKTLEECGLKGTDFAGGSRSAILALDRWAEGEEKEPTPTLMSWAEDPTKWFTKKSPYAKGLPSDTTQRIQQVLQAVVAHYGGDTYRNYQTALAIRAHFYELGILSNIDSEMTDYCNEQNTMLLSSTTEMLSKLIDQDDAPFIYEKTGTRIHAYMIDEFQDTSGMQWGNFKPLVSNALAEGYQNLIVGDVKQSIYRWRGGDWNLLDSEINDYEPAVHYDDKDSLKTNWRSLPAIVNFNNTFFTDLAGKLDAMIGSDRISRIYADVAQELPARRKGDDKPQGLVNISFLEPTDEEGNPIAKPTSEDLVAEASRRLPEVIIELQKQGYAARDIAILCRRNKECRWVAEALLTYKQEHPDCPYPMDIISGEALQIASRPTTQALILLMRHLLNPDSDILRAIAWSSYYQLEGMTVEESLERYFGMPEGDRNFHPELSHRPLYEMCEELIALLPQQACQEDAPFLQAFRDQVLDFSSRQSSDLSAFLQWWDESGCEKSISTPEGQNAIMILSVHKSKGLGMPVVILPNASWEIDIKSRGSDILWCEPKVEPFKRDILLPVKLSLDLDKTHFAEDLRAEREKAVIDNVNTAYVAFTRAKEAMVIMAPKPTKTDGTQLECWLAQYCEQMGQGKELTLGNWQRAETQKPHAEESQQAETPKPQVEVAPTTRGGLPAISILHDPAKPDVTAKERGTYIHAVLQEIRTSDEAQEVIEHLYLKGEIDPSVISQEEMQQTIRHLLEQPEAKRWFAPGLQVMNELTMMDGQGHQLRADRVVIDARGNVTVIDYKTGAPHPGYRRQVRNYIQALKKIGFEKVEGYLWFIKEDSPHALAVGRG